MNHTFKKIIFLYFIFFQTLLFATNHFWVNGGGRWSDFTHHWATSSGGSVFCTSEPSDFDNVYFDANSFSTNGDSVWLDDPYVRCATFDCSQVSDFVTMLNDTGNQGFYINGSILFSSHLNFIYSKGILYYPYQGGNYDIDLAGDSLKANLNINGGVGSVFNLQSNFIGRDLEFESGTFNTNNHDLHVSDFAMCGGANPQVMNLGTSTIYLRAVYPPYYLQWCSALGTLNSSLSKIYIDNTSATALSFSAHNNYFPYISASNPSSIQASIDIDSCIIDHLDIFSPTLSFSFSNLKADSIFFTDTVGKVMISDYSNNDSSTINFLITNQPTDLYVSHILPGIIYLKKFIANDSLTVYQRYTGNSYFIDNLICSGITRFDTNFTNTWDTMHISNCLLNDNAYFGTGNYFGRLTLNKNKSYSFRSGITNFVDTLIATGQLNNFISLKSNLTGSNSFISLNKDFCGNYLDIQDMSVNGATAYAGSNSNDISNNTGWIFSNCIFTQLQSIDQDSFEIKNSEDQLKFIFPSDDVACINLYDCLGRLVKTANRANDFTIDKYGELHGIILCRIVYSDASKSFSKKIILEN